MTVPTSPLSAATATVSAFRYPYCGDRVQTGDILDVDEWSGQVLATYIAPLDATRILILDEHGRVAVTPAQALGLIEVRDA